MDRIRPWLYIGAYRHTRDPHLLETHNIQAMLQLAKQVEYPGIAILVLRVPDFSPIPPRLLQQGVTFVREQKQRNHTTLVACYMGINRSAAFCTAALKEEEGLSLLEAFGQVKQNHQEAMPHPLAWQSLCDYYAEDVPLEKLYG